jgi:hypothetical protein
MVFYVPIAFTSILKASTHTLTNSLRTLTASTSIFMDSTSHPVDSRSTLTASTSKFMAFTNTLMAQQGPKNFMSVPIVFKSMNKTFFYFIIVSNCLISCSFMCDFFHFFLIKIPRDFEIDVDAMRVFTKAVKMPVDALRMLVQAVKVL